MKQIQTIASSNSIPSRNLSLLVDARFEQGQRFLGHFRPIGSFSFRSFLEVEHDEMGILSVLMIEISQVKKTDVALVARKKLTLWVNSKPMSETKAMKASRSLKREVTSAILRAPLETSQEKISIESSSSANLSGGKLCSTERNLPLNQNPPGLSDHLDPISPHQTQTTHHTVDHSTLTSISTPRQRYT